MRMLSCSDREWLHVIRLGNAREALIVDMIGKSPEERAKLINEFQLKWFDREAIIEKSRQTG